MNCDIDFISVRKSKFCSDRCRQVFRINKKNTGILGKDYIQCPVCNQHVKQITSKHAKSHGYETINSMKEAFQMDYITCSKMREAVTGENNPGYQHGGKFSKFSKKFVHGYDADWHKAWAERHSDFRSNNKHLFKTNIEYWQAKYPSDASKAEHEYKKFQVRDLDHFINKYGEDEGKKRHQLKIERWVNSMPKHNFSAISQELFNEIMTVYDADPADIYYATFDRDDMQGYENKEYRLKTKQSYVMPDFVDLSKNKIIEFDGDYWHSEAKVNPEREQKRHDSITDKGYSVHYVREQDYKRNKQQVIEECIAFLTK